MLGEKFTRFGIVGGGIFFAINGLANPFFTLYASEMGISMMVIGLMVTLKAVLPIFLAMPSGQLIDSIGPMKMLQYGVVILLASLMCIVFANGIFLLVLSQILMGIAVVIMASALQVLVSNGDRKSRNEAIKRYSMWMAGGSMVGPLLGGLITAAFGTPSDGYRAAFIAATAAAILFLLALTWLSRSYPHPTPGDSEISARDVFSVEGVALSYKSGINLALHRKVQFGLIGTFLVMYIQALYMSFLPLYLVEHDFAIMMISLVIALKGLTGMLSRYLLGWLMRHVVLETILMTAGGIAAICVVLTPLAVQSPASMIINTAILGGAVGVNLPVSIMIMIDAVGDGERGKLMGLRLISNRFSQILSPAMFGLLGQAFGLTAAFYCGGALLVVTILGFSAYSYRNRNS